VEIDARIVAAAKGLRGPNGVIVAARVAGSSGLSRGDPTWLSWAPGAQHLFETDGTRRADMYRQDTATQLA